MAIETLLIVNKSGGLIYHRNFGEACEKRKKLTSNDYLIIASTLHSILAISGQITPRALKLNQDDIDYTIPYVPGVGMPSSDSSNNSKMSKLGSFKGDDYFKESFTSWNKSGLRQLSTDQFTMFVYQTLTGLKFIAISSSVLPKNNEMETSKNLNLANQIGDNFLRKIYCIYSDYVMKDPLYSLEMPIKSENFDKKVQEMVYNVQ
ncbi:hypothetical protein KAFR_0E02840 [Kazachstania africana CBS 2517]|uniref:Trafficking protein particle complex subunit n=1 Tax=Kazachstania africana (strain ATCC 22294 / BCRC 22015 / CBS 2517 / CECT 1963 / NBRC 1671 / NRRL Y-8276) TaxID=1071382 RepID=H2AVN6_KAZAF|nr:hypothetical protein KAFR_0E02840 [Kazachstania africana CBS 2517]CCF58436.1 hypothetical protein KAFR_0E02840 [Kazachstania africana CBS 2517]